MDRPGPALPAQAGAQLAPADGPIVRQEGPAFPGVVRWGASLMVLLTGYWAWRSRPALLDIDWSTSSALLLGVAVLTVLWCLYWIWASRTGVDAAGIDQSWIWNKRVAWQDIAQARFIGIPGLTWLIAPRLAVKARGGALYVFHSADPGVLTVLARYVATGNAWA